MRGGLPDVPQVAEKCRGALITLGGLSGEQFEHDRVQRVGNGRDAGRWRLRILGLQGEKRVLRAVALERPPGGQALVEHDAKGKEVGTGVDQPASRLFRRHIERRPLDCGQKVNHGLRGCRSSDCGRGRRRKHCPFGDSKIKHLGTAAFGYADVGRLDVAMDDAFPMRLGERGSDFLGEPQDLVRRYRAGADAFFEASAFDELHHEKGNTLARLAEVVDLSDIGMIQG